LASGPAVERIPAAKQGQKGYRREKNRCLIKRKGKKTPKVEKDGKKRTKRRDLLTGKRGKAVHRSKGDEE